MKSSKLTRLTPPRGRLLRATVFSVAVLALVGSSAALSSPPWLVDGATKSGKGWKKEPSPEPAPEPAPEPEPEPEPAPEEPLAENLIANGSFETDLAGWGRQGTAVLSRSTADATDGSASLRVETNGAKDHGASGVVSLEAARTYHVAFWVKAPSGAALRVYVRDTSVPSNLGLQTFSGTGAWQEVALDVAAVNTAVHAVRITTASQQSAVAFHVDGVRVTSNDSSSGSTEVAPEPEPSPTVATGDTYFVGDFEDGTFGKWERLHDLTTRSSVATVANPSGYGKAAVLRVREENESWVGGHDTSVAGEAAFIGRNPPKAYELNAQSACYRGWFLLPSGTDARYPGQYRYPSPKQPSGKGRGFSVLWQQHEFQNGKWSNTVMLTPGGNVTVRSVGGVRSDWGTEDIDFFERTVAGPPAFDVWHELLVCAKWTWQKGNGGRMDVYLNGKHVFPTTDMPSNWRTQWYRSDGETKGYQYLQYGHYRASPKYWVGLPADYEDTVYVTPLLVGPDKASVGA